MNCTQECSPDFNILCGDNAAGKTSFLEALYYLSSGKSFRTSHLDSLIQHNHNQFSIFARLINESETIPVGVSKDILNGRKIRLNEKNVSSIVTVTNLLPMLFIGTNSHRIFIEGPKVRRQFLDWGLFHTDPTFYTTWKAFHKILTQRNAALKARASQSELQSWNHAFVDASLQIDDLRKKYIAGFSPYFQEIVSYFFAQEDIKLSYYSGWTDENDLKTHLNQSFFKETQAGHSLYGPHRADCEITINGHAAQHVLSQGQQKLLSYALRLAQGLHLKNKTHKSPIFLIDDLPSELDANKRQLLFNALSNLSAQVFITGIEENQLSDFISSEATRLFHVEHGCITRERGLSAL